MKGRIVFWAIICLAIVSAAVSGVMITNGRRDIALAKAAAAESEEARAEAEKKKARADEEAAKANKAAKEAEAAKEREERLAQEAKRQSEQLESENLAAKKLIAEKEAEAAKSRADAAADAKATAKAEADKAAALKAEAEAKARTAETQAAVAAVEAVKAEAKIAEAKALEIKKLDFERIERELAEWKTALDERERALQPEKTVADLAWAGGEEDSVFDADGNVRKVAKQPYFAENDKSLPGSTRRLAKTERVVGESLAEDERRVRGSVVSAIERLYVAALKEGRVIDADYYRKSLKALYPDWNYGEK